MTPVQELSTLYFETADGRSPFGEWLASFRDPVLAGRIDARLARIRSGNLGDYRELGRGIFELRLSFGPGYRIYAARERGRTILVLCGGDKGTQRSDILLARSYYEEYKRREKEAADSP